MKRDLTWVTCKALSNRRALLNPVINNYVSQCLPCMLLPGLALVGGLGPVPA